MILMKEEEEKVGEEGGEKETQGGRRMRVPLDNGYQGKVKINK